MAERLRLQIDGGTTFIMQQTWRDDAGTRLCLRGYALYFQIMQARIFEYPLVTCSTGNGLIFLEQQRDSEGGLLGSYTIVIPPILTAKLEDDLFPSYRGVYDLTAVSPLRTYHRLLEGTVTLRPSVRKAFR